MIAGETLREHPGFEGAEFDELAPPSDRRARIAELSERWREMTGDIAGRGGRTLVGERGRIDTATWERLRASRDERPITLLE
jgi:hypothetical protein